jgi:hypothetical protein
MKMLAALFVAVALISPAFAQKTNPQFTQAISKLHIVAPAAKPLLLYTGKHLTPDDKKQFLAAVIKTAPASARKHPASPEKASTITLSTSQFSQGNAYFVMNSPFFADIAHNNIYFAGGDAGAINFIIHAQPNTAYYLAITIHSDASNPQFTISTIDDNGKHINPENFTGSTGENEFAYGIVSNSAGDMAVTISSTNALWQFYSCVITSSTF